MSGELTTSLPKGGAPGQVLTKVSYDNYKVDWKDPAGGGGGWNQQRMDSTDRLYRPLEWF